MKKNIFKIIIVGFSFVLLLFSCGNKKKTAQKEENIQVSNLSFNYNEDYGELWDKADAETNKGLYKTALNSVDEILVKAKNDENTPQIVKCLIYKMKYNAYLKEDNYVIALNELQQTASTADFPLKQILHSITAESYWNYYQQNQWKINQRSYSVDFKNDDITTWDLKTIAKKTTQEYLLSLSSKDSLQHTTITDFRTIISYTNHSEELQPTLYDFLGGRAIQFFNNTQFNITKPADFFQIKETEYFGGIKEFTKLKISTIDITSSLYQAILVYQELEGFHFKKKNYNSAVHYALKRLEFVKNNASNSTKKELYLHGLEELTNNYSKETETALAWFYIADFYNSRGNEYDKETESYQWEKKKALTICEKTILEFPDSYGADKCKALKTVILRKNLSFNLEKSHRPNQPIRIVLEHRNVSNIFFKVVKVPWDFKQNRHEVLNNLNKLTPVKSWSVVLENKKDYQAHSSNLTIDPLPFGRYFIIGGTNADFNTNMNAVVYSSFWVTNMSYSFENRDDKGTEMLVVDSESGEGLDGVTIQQYTYEYSQNKNVYKKRTKYISDKEGMATILPHKTSRYSNDYFFKFTKGDDEYFTDNAIYFYNRHQREEEKRTRTTFFTDRAIYRPGQTVYFKGIVLNTIGRKHSIIPNTKRTITLYDVNYQKVTDLKVVTNDYGTFSGSFTLPMGTINGSFHISDEHRNRKYIKVEEYKRPKFEVNFEPIKGSYKLNETVSIKGNAKAFAGYFLDGATANYRISRTARFPYWCWFRWGYMPISPAIELESGSVKTNENGEFKLEFKAIADKSVDVKYSPTFTYKIEVDITDLNGETQSNTSYVSVGYNAMELSLDIKAEIDKQTQPEIMINATNLNGDKVQARGEIKITKLIEPNHIFRNSLLPNTDIKTLDKTEFYKLFPYDEFDKENSVGNLAKGEVITTLLFDTKRKDKFILPTPNMSVGRYILEVKSTDEFGTEVNEIKYITIFDSNENSIPTKETFWTSDLKLKGEPGEKATFIIGTAEKDLYVKYEIEHKGKIVHSALLTLHNEQRLITIPIKEKHRGNFSVSLSTTKHNRFISETKTIEVPFTNKELDITFESFRNKLLPGQKEEWKIKIRGKKGDKVAAELLATMYDASLDDFATNNIGLSLYQNYYSTKTWRNNCFTAQYSQLYETNWNKNYYAKGRSFSSMNWFGYNRFYGSNYERGNWLMYKNVMADSEPMVSMNSNIEPLPSSGNVMQDESEEYAKDEVGSGQEPSTGSGIERKKESKKPVKSRTNFNETAFFYPQLQTDKNGDVIVKFTIPESLTKWKFLALAHTKDLKIGTTEKTLVTQKELMVVPNAPRFFRAGDKMKFSSKVVNLSESNLTGTVQLELFNALTMQPIDGELKNNTSKQAITLEKEKSIVANWNIEIPEGYSAITYRVTARGGKHSDGEEMAIPVLTNRMLVTESLPLPVRKKGTSNFKFTKLINQSNGSKTLKNHKLTLEFTSNPAWYAIQALPYMMEYPYECAEQTFSRYYANSIASHIANSNPKIKRVFDAWSNYDTESFLSNLEKNQELKALILEETPWVLQAQDEQERKKRIALLFDLNKMDNEKTRTIQKLKQMQLGNGAWPWFKGMQPSRYITQHIVTGFGHLNQLKVESNSNKNMIAKAISYLDSEMKRDYDYLKKHNKEYQNHRTISNYNIQYLYARSFYPNHKIKQQHQEAYNYYYNQSKKHWLEFNLYTQGMIALATHRKGEKDFAKTVMASIKERAIYNHEMGMYWKSLTGGYYWYQAPIETQSLLIEAFDQINNDQESVNEMKVWLLKQKQTTDWKTTKATADACYALLLQGADILTETDVPTIKLGNTKVSISNTEAGTGYFKISWSDKQIKSEMGNVTITKKQNSVAWGSLYWQYFEDLDKITPHKTPLQLTKELYIVKNSNTGKTLLPITKETPIKVGDKIKVRVVLKTDRNLEYVHLKDMRAATFEPINVTSRYKWQDGLGYYETTKDASTNFFMDYVRKGTYVFEYELIAAQEGDFSNGITTIQCMYAPEFTSHSEGIRVEVK